MAEAPMFPQADPALCYVVEQVAKIDETQACTTGYYKALNNVLRRLEKTDEELNRLRMLVEGLNPRDASRYFREGMDLAIKEIRAEATQVVKSSVDQQVSRLERSASRLENTAFNVDLHMRELRKELGEVDGTLLNAAKQATTDLSDAIESGEKELLETSSCILDRFLSIEKAQMDIQDRFENLIRQNTIALPAGYRVLIGALILALGIAIGKTIL
jgi:predicted  nucleic acid-binding Zn-ribbon protein